MKKAIVNEKTDKRSVLVDARPCEFRVRTKDRADRLVAACKPITDVWYPRFRDAMQQGTDALMETYIDYQQEVLSSSGMLEDEIFRDSALQMILNGIYADWIAEETGFVKEATIETIDLIRNHIKSIVWSSYVLNGTNYKYEWDVFSLADSIDTLGLEYQD